jgi:hypothetical protein
MPLASILAKTGCAKTYLVLRGRLRASGATWGRCQASRRSAHEGCMRSWAVVRRPSITPEQGRGRPEERSRRGIMGADAGRDFVLPGNGAAG